MSFPITPFSITWLKTIPSHSTTRLVCSRVTERARRSIVFLFGVTVLNSVLVALSGEHNTLEDLGKECGNLHTVSAGSREDGSKFASARLQSIRMDGNLHRKVRHRFKGRCNANYNEMERFVVSAMCTLANEHRMRATKRWK